MKNNNLIDLLGLKDTTFQVELVSDIESIIDNGIEKYLKEYEEHEDKKKEFINLFKECFDELCLFMEKDPQRRVSVNCYTCIKGVNLRDQYGKLKK